MLQRLLSRGFRRFRPNKNPPPSHVSSSPPYRAQIIMEPGIFLRITCVNFNARSLQSMALRKGRQFAPASVINQKGPILFLHGLHPSSVASLSYKTNNVDPSVEICTCITAYDCHPNICRRGSARRNCKGYVSFLWKKPIFGPSLIPNPITHNHQN